MRFRRWVSAIAVLGMVMHAVALGYHHVSMFKELPLLALAELDPFGPGIICSASNAPADGDLSGGKGPLKAPTRPICVGHVAAHALEPGDATFVHLPLATIFRPRIDLFVQLVRTRPVHRLSNRDPPSVG